MAVRIISRTQHPDYVLVQLKVGSYDGLQKYVSHVGEFTVVSLTQNFPPDELGAIIRLCEEMGYEFYDQRKEGTGEGFRVVSTTVNSQLQIITKIEVGSFVGLEKYKPRVGDFTVVTVTPDCPTDDIGAIIDLCELMGYSYDGPPRDTSSSSSEGDDDHQKNKQGG